MSVDPSWVAGLAGLAAREAAAAVGPETPENTVIEAADAPTRLGRLCAHPRRERSVWDGSSDPLGLQRAADLIGYLLGWAIAALGRHLPKRKAHPHG